MSQIAVKDALDFLSQAAPKVWVQRALQWMILDGDLSLYAEKVEVDACTRVFKVTRELYEKDGELSGAKMDAAIRETFSPDLAEKLIGKDPYSFIHDDPYIVEGIDQIGAINLGFVLFSHGIDFEGNQLESELIDDSLLGLEWLFPSQDFVGSELEDAEFRVKFSGLSFETSRVELLLPTMTLVQSTNRESPRVTSRSIGRPRSWDWDGAMAHIVAQAQTPDGLPTGPGAQTKVEGIIADWFVEETGNSPAISQIRSRASRIMQMIEKGE